MTQLKIQLCTCLLIAASLTSLLPMVNSQNGTVTNASTDTDNFSGVKDDFYMPTDVENDIYAVGGDGNVWHWNGAWWWQVTSGLFVEDRIQVVAQDTIYGLSRNPTGYLNVYKWNGTAWAAVTRDGSLIDSFQVISETQIYAIGEDHQVYLWNGTNWNGCTCSVENVKDQIQVVNEQIYSINQQNQVVKWNGTEWEPLTDQTPIRDYFRLKSEEEIYSIDQAGNIILWNGESWRPLTSGFSATRRLFYVSSSEIFVLCADGMIWQWNGEEKVVITSTPKSSGSTFYRVKYLGGVMDAAPAIIAFRDELVIVGTGRGGALYAREWMPLKMESWDTARNGEYKGLTDWYPLNGSSASSPNLSIEDGKLYITVENEKGELYRRQFLSKMNWEPWKYYSVGRLTPGPFVSKGFTVIPSNSSGYPSEVSLVKYKDFNVNFSKPDWISNLIIYELNPQTFTSPNGTQTGTFQSLSQKLDYLQDLGITAVWISGTTWGDPQNFGYIYTQYANIYPGLIEPSLGTNISNVLQSENEFRDFITSAHQRGIKVIVDMVTHGVMSYSPLVGSKLTMPSYVKPYPIPLNITAHPDWFGAITNPSYEDLPLDKDYRRVKTRMIDFVGGYDQNDLEKWWVNVYTNFTLNYNIDGYRVDLGSSRFDLIAQIKTNVQKAGQELFFMPEGEPDDYPFNVGVYDFEQVDSQWLPLSTLNAHNKPDPAMGIVISDMKQAQEKVFPQLKRQYNSIPISCHDSMFYNLQGSLFKMGYGTFFTPFIPEFMAGEEFNNAYSPVPSSAGLWLLPSELQWNLLNNTDNYQFYQALKKAIEIRKNEPALSYFSPNITNPNVVLVDAFSSSISNSPTPYIRYLPDSSQAILITGNNNSDSVTFSMQLPLNKTDLEGYEHYDVVNLWNNTSTIMSSQDIADFTVTVNADNFSILKITPHIGPLPWTFYWPIIAALSALILCSFIVAAFLIRSHKINFIRRR